MRLKADILDAAVTFCEQPLVAPLVISSGTITALTEAQACVQVRVAGKTGIGRGSIYLSDVWAWPHPHLTHEFRDKALRGLCKRIAANLATFCGDAPAHPLELGLRLHQAMNDWPEENPPLLARHMAASPFDAAIHDAVGMALGKSAFAFYQEDCLLPSADPLFDGKAASAIRALIRTPARILRAWYLVCSHDNIETLRPWVQQRGFRCFKIKLNGIDPETDAFRTVEVYRTVVSLGAQNVELSIDTNEGNNSADSVEAYLRTLATKDPAAFAALRYIEQPTSRDIEKYSFDWHSVAAISPVLLDEGLTGFERLEIARQQGWSGFALKTCKGHSFALTVAAWARQNGMQVALQDLTNPGAALLHAALFAAHVPTINDVELNSPQFTPAANAGWRERLPQLYEPHGGVHVLDDPYLPGLGAATICADIRF